MTLYEHASGTLSRKTGITRNQLNYKGDNLGSLIERFGEVRIEYLWDPLDYRFIFVNLGNDQPLVELTEEFVTKETPAYSVEQKLELIKKETAELVEQADKKKFRAEVHAASMSNGKRVASRRPTRAEKNKAVTDKTKESQAIQRAIQKPLGTTEIGSAPKQPQTKVVSFAHAPSLPVLDRNTGKEQI